MPTEFYTFLFFLIPVLAHAFFFVNLYQYLHARRANKKAPGSFSERKVKMRELRLLASLFVVGVFEVIFVGCIVLAGLAVAFM